MKTRVLTLALGAVLGAGGTLFGISPEPGWHVVRPGETLDAIANRFLGDSYLWPELHRLNTEVENPHLIFPGRRIKVMRTLPSGEPNALIVNLARDVQKQPAPFGWQSADSLDILLERDAIRTGESSSARLKFDDGSSATISQSSLVFLRRLPKASAPASRQEIQIEVGQADFRAHLPKAGAAREIEIVVGSGAALVRSDESGNLSARARREPESASFMVYDGSGNVESAGRHVDLAAGTGSVVPAQGPPGPAEALLPAPDLDEPAADGELRRDEPGLSWSPVPAAVGYVVEVCADAECGSVGEIQRVESTATSLRGPLSEGSSYWRVTAVAASGLDGFPSEPRRFEAVETVRVPAPAISLLDDRGEVVASGSCLPAPPTAKLESADPAGPAVEYRILLDGNAVTPEALADLREQGRHELAGEAIVARGRAMRSAPEVFVLDLVSPTVELPPLVAPPNREVVVESKRWRSKMPKPDPDAAMASCAVGLEVRGDDGSWLPIACGEGSGATTELTLEGSEAFLEMRSREMNLRIGENLDIDQGTIFVVRLADSGCGLERAELSVQTSPHYLGSGRPLVLVTATDASGRSTTGSWHLGRQDDSRRSRRR